MFSVKLFIPVCVMAACHSAPASAANFKAKEAGDILIRLRGIGVVPDESSSISVIGGEVDLGDVGVVPPVLTLQYHFLADSQFSPYIGAGLNYMFFYNEDAPGGTVTQIDYENGVGYAVQAGFDVAIQGNWSINADVKKVYFNTDVSINNAAIAAEVDLDPWIVSLVSVTGSDKRIDVHSRHAVKQL